MQIENAVFAAYPARISPHMGMALMVKSTEQLEHELKVLTLQYNLSKSGLVMGGLLSGLVIAALAMSINTKLHFLSGAQYVAVFAILGIVFVIYFAFVFGRQAKIKAKISEKVAEMEASAGSKAN